MIWLSEIMIQEYELTSFEDVLDAVKQRVIAGELSFGIDVKPQFPDTPDNWEILLENTFTAKQSAD